MCTDGGKKRTPRALDLSHFLGVGQLLLFIFKRLFSFYYQVLPFDTSFDLLSKNKVFRESASSSTCVNTCAGAFRAPQLRQTPDASALGCRGISPVSGVNGNVVLQPLETHRLRRL